MNLHTHTIYSDGSAMPEEYVIAAKGLGFSGIGFSDHSPLPFDNTFALKEEKVDEYCRAVLDLKEKHKSDFTILLGMEVDFIPGTRHTFDYFRDTYPLDYIIGSVHLVRNGSNETLWFIDGPDPATYDDGLNQLFDGDIRAGVTAYYHQINEMLSTSRMEIIGHLDKIKMHNRGRFFNEEEIWYQKLVDETLALIKEKNVTIEVNTRGLYKKRSDSLFPGENILKKTKSLRIPVIISSDAHKPSEIGNLFPETIETLKHLGLTPLNS